MTFFPIYVISLPGSPKRLKISYRLNEQGLAWQWIDGVYINSLDDIPPHERSDIEGYGIPRLRNDADYICRIVGAKRAMRNALWEAGEGTGEWVIILQDDAELCGNFAARFCYYSQLAAPDTDVLLLFYSSVGTEESKGLVSIQDDIRSMAAFAIRPAFARTLCAMLEQWGGEDDRIWYQAINCGANIQGTNPMLAKSSQRGSDIISGVPELKGLWIDK